MTVSRPTVRRPRPLVLCGLLVASAAPLLTSGGCVVLVRQPDVVPIDSVQAQVSVEAPVKAHLADGSIVLFPDGAMFTRTEIIGAGMRYGADAQGGRQVEGLSLDSVVAMESFPTNIDEVASAVATVVATPLAVVGAAVASVAIFGSCPTVYSDSAGTLALEAESFSNSVASIIESRDVDRLRAVAGADGGIALEIHNEALETHYLNHLELVAVEHASDEEAVPAPLGRAYALRDLRPAGAAVNRAGEDVSGTLAAADGSVYRTPAVVLGAADEADPTDYIDLDLPAPAGDTAAVFLRLRSSLLSTVLFYEFMLAGQGAESLDWLSRGLNNVGTVMELGDFYHRRMGLRVEVWDGSAYREVGRVPEVGPIAFGDVAVAFPTPPGESVRVRLRFIADSWRIDRVAIADARSVPIRVVPLDRIEREAGVPDGDAHEKLSRPDEAYLVTQPGERFRATFSPGRPAHGDGQTLFVAAQGFYTEWVRGSWIRDNPEPVAFQPTDATLIAALRRWSQVSSEYEARFASSRVPVR
jgi:hypothetical protein